MPDPASPSPQNIMKRRNSLPQVCLPMCCHTNEQTIDNAKRRVSQIFQMNSAPSLRSTFEKEETIIGPELPSDQPGYTQFRLWLQEQGISFKEEKEGLRRSLSQRLSWSLRKSWSRRRSYILNMHMGIIEGEDLSCVGEASEKVKRVKGLRDWSQELSEDDIVSSPTTSSVCESADPIIWADDHEDIGKYWRFVDPRGP
jgi:hypothetical protein